MAGPDPAIHHSSKESCEAMDPRLIWREDALALLPGVTREQKKSPAFRQDLPCSCSFTSELPAALTLLIGFLALTVGVLLLLAGLVAAALLLTGFFAGLLVLLARVLVLTRVLVLAGHRSRLPCLDRVRDNAINLAWFPWNFRFPANCFALAGCLKSTSVQAP
jgi:hypothetical protein